MKQPRLQASEYVATIADFHTRAVTSGLILDLATPVLVDGSGKDLMVLEAFSGVGRIAQAFSASLNGAGYNLSLRRIGIACPNLGERGHRS